jgi:choline kinase
MINAVLYVAGRAMRLGKAAERQPKVLLEFGGKTLLERHVRILADLGVPKLFVVTGFMREKLQAQFSGLESRYGVRITEFFNPYFTEGSALSMHSSLPALESATEGILLMDGDVLYDHRMLERLTRSQHSTVLLIDRAFSTADDDPVLVPLRDGRPFDFIKKWKGEAAAVGESIGFFRAAGEDIPLLIEETKARFSGVGRTESYDDIIRVLVRAGRFGAEDVTGIPWTEIDFPEDIAKANSIILPALDPKR